MSEKISGLAEQTSGTLADDDLFVDVDVSDTSMAPTGTDKRSKWSSIKASLKTYFDTLYKATQVVTATSNTVASSSANVPNDGTIPQESEMTAFPSLALTITPKNASSKLIINVELNIGCAASASNFVLAIFQDSNTDASCAWAQTLASSNVAVMKQTLIVTAGSTSARTYKVYFGCLGGTTAQYINRSQAQATLFGAAAISTSAVVEYLP